jgi:serine/threonine protein kinase
MPQENIFINAEGRALLADFGLSIVGENTAGRMTSGSDSAGNPRYTAPERILATEKLRRSAASDVYAFACVCLFVSSPPHTGSRSSIDRTFRYTLVNAHSRSIRITPWSPTKS